MSEVETKGYEFKGHPVIECEELNGLTEGELVIGLGENPKSKLFMRPDPYRELRDAFLGQDEAFSDYMDCVKTLGHNEALAALEGKLGVGLENASCRTNELIERFTILVIDKTKPDGVRVCKLINIPAAKNVWGVRPSTDIISEKENCDE